MKKSILGYLILLPFLLTAQQSYKDFSFYIQGGYKSSSFINEDSHHGIISETETRHHLCIILNAGLQWNINSKWRIGPSFSYDHFGTKKRSLEFSNLNFLIRSDRVWHKSPKYTFYSGIAAGVRKVREFEEEKEVCRKVNMGYQIYLIGMNIKIINRFFLDANIGWGNTGILSIGAKYDF